MRSDRPDEQTNGPVAEEAVESTQAGAGEAQPAETPEAADTGDEGAPAGAAEGGGEQRSGETADADVLQDRYLRIAAEFDNYRKRTERERAESWVRAQAELVRNLLDGLDDLQRVADYSAESTGLDALLEGVQMVERKLLRALESGGLEVIDAAGQRFDPAEHEALMTVAAESPDQDEVVGDVFQTGYRFKGILLRPARVQVQKYEG